MRRPPRFWIWVLAALSLCLSGCVSTGFGGHRAQVKVEIEGVVADEEAGAPLEAWIISRTAWVNSKLEARLTELDGLRRVDPGSYRGRLLEVLALADRNKLVKFDEPESFHQLVLRDHVLLVRFGDEVKYEKFNPEMLGKAKTLVMTF